ncbi:hypothetical protein ACWD6R_18515 [Streptomyces sp. NPDC005151]
MPPPESARDGAWAAEITGRRGSQSLARPVPDSTAGVHAVGGTLSTAEDRIRAARATGLTNLPLHDTAHNQIWLEIVQIALDPWKPAPTRRDCEDDRVPPRAVV